MPKRIKYKDRMVAAEAVAVDSTDESASTYELADGSIVSLRTTVTAIYRVIDEFDEGGDPVYSMHYNTQMTLLSAPDELRVEDGDPEVHQ